MAPPHALTSDTKRVMPKPVKSVGLSLWPAYQEHTGPVPNPGDKNGSRGTFTSRAKLRASALERRQQVSLRDPNNVQNRLAIQ